VAQLNGTGAAVPAFGVKWQSNLSAGGWLDVPASFGADKIKWRGLTETAIATAVGQGHVLAGCLDATGLTAVPGSVQRDAAAVPNVVLAQDQCIAIGAVFDFDTTVTASDSWQLRLVNQDGTLFAGSPVYLTVVGMPYTRSR